jgi:hypothetical protein
MTRDLVMCEFGADHSIKDKTGNESYQTLVTYSLF